MRFRRNFGKAFWKNIDYFWGSNTNKVRLDIDRLVSKILYQDTTIRVKHPRSAIIIEIFA